MSELGDILKTMIRAEGPMPLERYMALALSHPKLGYYMTRDPLGAAGDFTTAAEISQMFGELLGLWAAQFWVAMGSPKPVRIIELGPGRGVLMQDFVRASRVISPFRDALDVHLVETSPVLAHEQKRRLTLSGVAATWHESIETIPKGPAIFIANEFFDALPVRHYVKTPIGWCERTVRVTPAGDFEFTHSPTAEDLIHGEAEPGAVLEIGAIGQKVMSGLARRIAEQGGAALVIDYGYTETSLGETLQAVRHHAFANPLEEPGLADITAHVDFSALARAAKARGLQTFGPVTQGEFLLRLGVVERAEALMRSASEQQRAGIQSALARLVAGAGEIQTPDGAIDGMGQLFKVLAVAQNGLPQPAGFSDEPIKP